MTDHISEERRSWIMSRVRSKNTKPELILRQLLYSGGFRYRIHKHNIPGRPDISNKSKKIAIFVNGCFWHRHGCKRTTTPKTNVKYWNEKFNKTIQRDKANLEKLKKLKWKVIIIWECEINDLETLRKKLFDLKLKSYANSNKFPISS